MKQNTLTIEQLLVHPKVKDLVLPGDAERIATSLATSKQVSKDPIYIRILNGVGAWFASIFLILCLGISNMFKSGAGSIIWGIIFLAAAISNPKASSAVDVTVRKTI